MHALLSFDNNGTHMSPHGKPVIQQESTAVTSPPFTPPRLTTILTAISLVFVVLTPVIYFCGRAFHDGWYETLRLDQSMFPLDTAGMLTEGAIAWGNALSISATALTQVIKSHPWRFPLLIIVLSITWVIITVLGRWLDTLSNKWKAKPSRPTLARLTRFLGPFIKPTFVITLAFLVVFEFLFGMTSIFGLIAMPFYLTGQHAAEEAIRKGFLQSPQVRVKSPTGDQAVMREIGCGAQFCGLWDKDHAVTVPVSAITWLESTKPEK